MGSGALRLLLLLAAELLLLFVLPFVLLFLLVDLEAPLFLAVLVDFFCAIYKYPFPV